MAHIIITRRAQLSTAVNTESLPGLLYAGENDAHVFIISAVRGDTPVTLSGAVTALFIRPDESTVALDGEIVNGCASVTLPQSCYTQTGRFQLTVFVTENGVKTAVYCLSGNVKKTTTETIIDPGHVVPDISDIIAEYATMQQAVEDCEDAEAAANTAASAADAAAANVAGAIADAYNTSGTYAVGDYCTKDGKLYRCVSAISTAEAWTAAHWAEVTAMGEVVEITGALSDKLQEVADNQIVEETESAAVASIPDAAKAAAKGVDITIAPVQAGSGDPSPTNVRPISGWTAVGLGRTGKNMLPKMVAGTYEGNGVKAVVDANGVATLSGTTTSSGNAFIIPLAEPFVVPKAGLVYCMNNSVANGSLQPSIEKTNPVSGDPSIAYAANPINRTQVLSDAKTGAAYGRIRFYLAGGVTISGTFAPAIMAEADSYEPNDGENSLQTIALPSEAGTVYGGTLHINEDGSGVLTVTHGNIASYDGETLPGEWISDRDVYAEGTTPTTGAQVVYELAAPDTYNLTAAKLGLMMGSNNIYADSGNVAVKYVVETKGYIDSATEDVSGLKTAVDGMTTATASDAGKALKAKTVADGKVTEWEFGETAIIDDTLTQAGQAADAKKTGDEIGDLKSALRSGAEEDAEWHLGFYLDENGDLCQVDDE